MSDIIYIVAQSLVQSITEFLPISSSGHLLMMKHLFGWQTPNLILDLVLHLGTTLAIAVYLWRSRRQFEGGWAEIKRLAIWVVAAMAVTGAVGIVLAPVIRSFYDLRWLAFNYLFLGALLLASRWMSQSPERARSQHQMTLWDAMAVGLMQGVAVFPGISRSGMTIIALLLLGFNRPFAFAFSFLLAVPTIVAASGYEFIHEYQSFQAFSGWHLILAFSLAAVLSYPLLVVLKRLVVTNKFYLFSIYCFLICALLVSIAVR